MASKLLTTYGFNKDNMKVLLGGWNTWKENNGTNANGYPIEGTAGASTPAGVIGNPTNGTNKPSIPLAITVNPAPKP